MNSCDWQEWNRITDGMESNAGAAYHKKSRGQKGLPATSPALPGTAKQAGIAWCSCFRSLRFSHWRDWASGLRQAPTRTIVLHADAHGLRVQLDVNLRGFHTNWKARDEMAVMNEHQGGSPVCSPIII